MLNIKSENWRWSLRYILFSYLFDIVPSIFRSHKNVIPTFCTVFRFNICTESTYIQYFVTRNQTQTIISQGLLLTRRFIPYRSGQTYSKAFQNKSNIKFKYYASLRFPLFWFLNQNLDIPGFTVNCLQI